MFDSVCYNDAYHEICFHNTDELGRGDYAPSPHLYNVAPSDYKSDREKRLNYYVVDVTPERFSVARDPQRKPFNHTLQRCHFMELNIT